MEQTRQDPRGSAHRPLHGRDDRPPGRALDRRDFLKLTGFSLGGVLIAGCQQAKMEKAIPFLIKPEEVTPGVSTWYATTCGGCPAGCGVMAKVRDGRPIKLEGLSGHPVSQGGLCAAGQAHLLGLYDSQRLMEPVVNGTAATWEAADAAALTALEAVRASGGTVRVLTGTVAGLTEREAIRRFLAGFRDGRHVEYDAVSASAILDAHAATHGARVLPRYRFDRARVIAAVEADFLGTWISPVEFTAAHRRGRLLDGAASRFSYHAQFESRFSLTGSKADERVSVSPPQARELIRQLAAVLAATSGNAPQPSPDPPAHVTALADRLWNARGESLVVCGLNDLASQTLVNTINHALGNYGSTVDIAAPSHQLQGNDAELLRLIGELASGAVDAIVIHGCNPVYDLPDGDAFAGLLKKTRLVIRSGDRLDETGDCAHLVCPEPHALESWNDAEAVAGTVTVTQPVIQRFGNTRPFMESLSVWSGERTSAPGQMRSVWERTVFPRRTGEASFQKFWDDAVAAGFVQVEAAPPATGPFTAVPAAAPAQEQPQGDFAILLYPSVAMLDGRHAHNPWLQELPDPVTKIVWDNYVSISPADAERLGVEEGDVLRVESGGRSIELPAHLQPGQHDGVAAVPLGYGRMGTGRFTAVGPEWLEAKPTVAPGALVGVNAAPLMTFTGGRLAYDARRGLLTKTGRRTELACTQEHHRLEVPEELAAHPGERRPIVQEASLEEYRNDPSAGRFRTAGTASLWPDEHKATGHRWGMAIDLSACTGCSACVVSCMAENNIPVVGRDEVGRNRELAWIRIDRYYEESDGRFSAAYQPMLCQHCANAPCETVCPVLATVHSEEGLNQQVYNRCVGTRYCSNNCPYKVRRFNWFDYGFGDDMQRLVLNPDVTTRERGIMEKCSFCVQRIQEAKITARNRGVPLADLDIRPACAQSCPAQAIVFGDMNDPASGISRQMKDPRYYRVLEELGVKPSVGYMTLVRNSEHAPHG